MTRRLIACVLLAALLGCGTAAACQPVRAIPAEKPITGLQLFYAADERSWQLADWLGVRWVRLELQWRALEPQDGRYDWAEADKILAPAIARKLGILALLNHAPDWVKPDDLPRAFARFAAAVLDRYGVDMRPDGVRYWEFFNEPNLDGFGWSVNGGDVAANAARYAAVLAAANFAVRPHHPQAVIVSAGLSPDGQNPEQFLRALYAAGAAQCFDILGLHPYGREGKLADTLKSARAFLQEVGDAKKPVWFTEYGTDGDSDRGRLLTSGFGETPNLTALFWFNERDIHRFTDRYGLVDYAYAPKPETALFRQLLAKERP